MKTLEQAIEEIAVQYKQSITPDDLRYVATHESLYRNWTFNLLMGLADALEEK